MTLYVVNRKAKIGVYDNHGSSALVDNAPN